jgi:hypothetical protein
MKANIKKFLEIFGKFLGFILLLLIIASIYKFLNLGGLFNSEITAYAVICKEKPVLNKCDNPEYAHGKTTYKVNESRQEVIYWVEGFPPERLTKCAIKDKRNWSCKYNDESAEFGFNNGNFWEISLEPSHSEWENDLFSRIYYPSRTEYLMVRCEYNLFCFLFINLLE